MWHFKELKENHTRSITKSVVWRIWGVLFLALVTYIYTNNWITTTLVTVLHHGIFLFVYYAHERFWLHVRWLKGSKWKPYARVFTYEMVLANIILGTITFLLTGELHTMTAITLTYVCNKYWMYCLYDWLWAKARWQTANTGEIIND